MAHVITYVHTFIRPRDPSTSVAPLHRLARLRPRPTSVAAESHSGSRTDSPAATVVTTHMQRYHICPHMSAPDLNRCQMSTRTGGVRSHHGLSVYAAIVRDALSQGGGRYQINRDSSNTRMVRRSGNITVSRPLAQSGHRKYCLTFWSMLWFL